MRTKGRTERTRNENIECPCCKTDGVVIEATPRGNFIVDRTYRCDDCGHWWELNDDGNREVLTMGEVEHEPANKTPIDHDEDLGVVPDN